MTALRMGAVTVALCKEGKFDDCVGGPLFAPGRGERRGGGAAGAGAGPPERESKPSTEGQVVGGKPHRFHKAEVFGPYPHDDRFAVRFVFDITHKPSRQANDDG